MRVSKGEFQRGELGEATSAYVCAGHPGIVSLMAVGAAGMPKITPKTRKDAGEAKGLYVG